MKVMLRIWPEQGAQRSAESTSFLKVDPRKKQVTLYDPAAGPPGSAGSRRATPAAVPKMFAFDAVFPQDSEQVRVAARRGDGTTVRPAPLLLLGRRGAPRRAGLLCLPFWPPRPSGRLPGPWPASQAAFPGRRLVFQSPPSPTLFEQQMLVCVTAMRAV